MLVVYYLSHMHAVCDICIEPSDNWRVTRRMRLYFHSKKICAYTRDVPNNEHFVSVEALAGRLEMVAKLCPSLLIVVCDTLAYDLDNTPPTSK